MTGRLVVLASGGGTNCQAILDACADGDLEAEVVAVVTNNADAGVATRAARAGVPLVVVEHAAREPQARRAEDIALGDEIAAHDPDLVVLAGWMRILGDEICARFEIINLHPALPGEFPGVDAIGRAFRAWQRGEITESGVMIHRVPDSGVDVGPVVTTATVRFERGDTEADFEARMHRAEHRLIVEGIREALAAGS